MPRREKYICQSRACRREIEVEILPRQTGGEISNPRCTCGSEMKKPYETPGLIVYGDIQALTKGTGMLGATIDGSMGLLKT
jgi:hypothetical protein